jgi:hypothetical protein
MKDDVLISKIYNCATDVTYWPDVLTAIMDKIKASKAVLCCNNEETLIWAQSIGLGRNYTDHVYKLREIDSFHAMRQALPLGEALLSHEIIPLEEFKKSKLYTSWAAPNQCVHIAGGLLSVGKNEWSALRFFRGETDPVFEPETKAYLNRIMPHMCKAVSISRKLSRAGQSNTSTIMKKFSVYSPPALYC